MLLRALFLIALIALLAETMVHGAAALAQATLRERASASTRAALAAGIARAHDAAVAALAAGEDPSRVAVPAPFATCAARDADGCAFTATVTIALASPAASPAPVSCGPTACESYLQGNAAVAESRIGYHLSASVAGRSGAVLARRDADALFRTTHSAPYAELVGSLDATLDAASFAVGDDGGASTTLVTAAVRPANDPSATPRPANVWQPLAARAQSAAPSWDY